MKDLNELKEAESEDFNYIGERLKLIREELKANDPIGDKRKSSFSVKNLAKLFDMHYTSLINVERGTISLITIKMVLYYYSLGYNPMWILMADNEFIPKQNIGENLVYQSDVQESYMELESVIAGALTDFKSKI